MMRRFYDYNEGGNTNNFGTRSNSGHPLGNSGSTGLSIDELKQLTASRQKLHNPTGANVPRHHFNSGNSVSNSYNGVKQNAIYPVEYGYAHSTGISVNNGEHRSLSFAGHESKYISQLSTATAVNTNDDTALFENNFKSVKSNCMSNSNNGGRITNAYAAAPALAPTHDMNMGRGLSVQELKTLTQLRLQNENTHRVCDSTNQVYASAPSRSINGINNQTNTSSNVLYQQTDFKKVEHPLPSLGLGHSNPNPMNNVGYDKTPSRLMRQHSNSNNIMNSGIHSANPSTPANSMVTQHTTLSPVDAIHCSPSLRRNSTVILTQINPNVPPLDSNAPANAYYNNPTLPNAHKNSHNSGSYSPNAGYVGSNSSVGGNSTRSNSINHASGYEGNQESLMTMSVMANNYVTPADKHTNTNVTHSVNGDGVGIGLSRQNIVSGRGTPLVLESLSNVPSLVNTRRNSMANMNLSNNESQFMYQHHEFNKLMSSLTECHQQDSENSSSQSNQNPTTNLEHDLESEGGSVSTNPFDDFFSNTNGNTPSLITTTSRGGTQDNFIVNKSFDEGDGLFQLLKKQHTIQNLSQNNCGNIYG